MSPHHRNKPEILFIKIADIRKTGGNISFAVFAESEMSDKKMFVQISITY